MAGRNRKGAMTQINDERPNWGLAQLVGADELGVGEYAPLPALAPQVLAVSA